MSYVSDDLRKLIYTRASNKCEYCLIDELYTIKRHEIDHIVAEKHGGLTNDDNLCLSCFDCNRHKGSDLTSIDPETNTIVRLFNPRTLIWSDHFTYSNGYILGKTSIGRVTANLLQFNNEDRVNERERLAKIQRYQALRITSTPPR